MLPLLSDVWCMPLQPCQVKDHVLASLIVQRCNLKNHGDAEHLCADIAVLAVALMQARCFIDGCNVMFMAAELVQIRCCIARCGVMSIVVALMQVGTSTVGECEGNK